MLCYLHYFKLANINVVTRFRTVVSRAPDEVLLVNATSGDQYTRQQERLDIHDFMSVEIGETFPCDCRLRTTAT